MPLHFFLPFIFYVIIYVLFSIASLFTSEIAWLLKKDSWNCVVILLGFAHRSQIIGKRGGSYDKVRRSAAAAWHSAYAPGMEVLLFFTTEVASLDERVLPLISPLMQCGGKNVSISSPAVFDSKSNGADYGWGGGKEEISNFSGENMRTRQGAKIRHPLGKR